MQQVSNSSFLTEQWLLRQSGPPLSSCKNQSANQILIQSEMTQNIIFQKDVHSNIRAYYYSLLSTIFEAQSQVSCRIQRHFKNILLNQRIKLDQFQIPILKLKHKEFYNNISLKKLIVEMLKEIKQREQKFKQNPVKRVVRSIINQYPIMDLVMTLLIRSVINYHRHTNIPVSSKISTRVIAQCFWELFGFGSYQIAPNIWVFEIIDTTYNSTGAYEEIGKLSQFLNRRSLSLQTVISVEKPTFQIIQEASKQESISDLNLSLDEINQLFAPSKQQKRSVTSSLESIHLKLKCFDFEESVSEISRRQSMEEDSFVDKQNLFMIDEKTLSNKFGKQHSQFDNKEIMTLRKKRPCSPLRANKNTVNRL